MSHDAHGTGHGDAHGGAHGDVHGHGAEQAVAVAHGPAEIPPPPAVRWISPAPEDFAGTPLFRHLVWPVVWAVVFLYLHAAVRGSGWTAHDGHGAPGGPGHAAPHR
jgi:hypothetical protein